MSDFKLGSSTINDIKLGSSQVSAIYIGGTKVWPTIVLTAFLMDPNDFSTDIEACFVGNPVVTYYHDGAGTYPVSGDGVYVDANGITPFAGNLQWYKTAGNTSISINNSGKVLGRVVC